MQCIFVLGFVLGYTNSGTQSHKIVFIKRPGPPKMTLAYGLVIYLLINLHIAMCL